MPWCTVTLYTGTSKVASRADITVLAFSTPVRSFCTSKALAVTQDTRHDAHQSFVNWWSLGGQDGAAQ